MRHHVVQLAGDAQALLGDDGAQRGLLLLAPGPDRLARRPGGDEEREGEQDVLGAQVRHAGQPEHDEAGEPGDEPDRCVTPPTRAW